MRIKAIEFPFDPTAELDFLFKWVRWCAPVGDTVVSYALTCDPGLLVFSSSLGGNIVTAWVKLDPANLPTIGQRPQVHCSIVTSSIPPRKDRRSCELVIVPR